MTENERIAVLETRMKDIDEKLDRNSKKLDEIHDAFMQAKGAKWVVVGMATIGGAVTAFLVKMIYGGLPR